MNMVRVELAAAVVVLLLVFGVRYGRDGAILSVTARFLAHRSAGWVAGILTALAVWWVWGSFSPPPIVSDEASYLLQAQLFASGRWSAPTPPLPEFFEQEHVLLLPRFASKYPPGHALVLTPGVLVQLPALVPLLLSGIAGALVFLLARRVSNAWVAGLTWLLWLSASGNLIYRASYFSESTTSVLWLVAWWAALQYIETRHRRWLVLIAACVGWGAITRPLTMLAFSIPMGVVLLRGLWTSRRLTDALVPLAIVASLLAIIPLWSKRVTGDWQRTPLNVYTATYMPWDAPGFGLVTTPGTREGPPDAQAKFRGFMERHRSHRIETLPRILGERLSALNDALFGGWRQWLLPIALLALPILGLSGWFALLTGICLLAAYLIYAHAPTWGVYYLEAFPVPAFLVAVGLWRLATILAMRLPAYKAAAPSPATRSHVALALVLLLFLPLAALDTAGARNWWQRRASHRLAFDSLVAAIPERRALVFVRHDPVHSFYTGHVENYANMHSARIWLAHDRGPDNDRLRAVAPDRTPYLYDEKGHFLEPLRR